MTAGDSDLTGLLIDGRHIDVQLFGRHTAADLRRSMAEVATLTLGVSDKRRVLIRSGLLTGPPPVCALDGALFELAQVDKTGSEVRLLFEDAVVAELRRKKGLLSAKEGTTTVTAFAARLVSEVPGATLLAEPGPRNLIPLARGSEGDEDEDSWTALKRLANDRGWRCFADRGVVYLGSDTWLLARDVARNVVEHTDGVEDLNWEVEAGSPAVRGSFLVTASRWGVPPGLPVQLLEQGPGSGLWLVESYERALSSKTARVGLVRPQPALPEPKPEPRDDGGSVADTSGTGGSSVSSGPVSSRGLVWPVSGRISSPFGPRGGRQHGGVDVAVPIGTPIVAALAGTVAFAGWANGYGNVIYLEHPGGMVTRYAHLSRISVLRGAPVGRGQRLGLSGNTGNSTGPHLHFEVRVGGSAVDPLPYLPRRD